jgi:hypothetical protein
MKTMAMLDIETLGLEPSAVVLSVGAVLFTDEAMRNSLEPGLDFNKTFFVVPDIGLQIANGRTINQDTLKFWQKANQKSIADWAGADSKYKTWPHAACYRLHDFIKENGVVELWVNGLDFDVPILKSLFEQASCKWPLPYNAVRDARTIYNVCPKQINAKPNDLKDHTAINDCKGQIIKLWEYWPR